MTSLTCRIPTTPEVHERLRDVKESHEEVETYDGLLRLWLDETGASGTFMGATDDSRSG